MSYIILLFFSLFISQNNSEVISKYQFENDSLIQTIYLEDVDQGINFEILVKNKKYNIQSSLRGHAIVWGDESVWGKNKNGEEIILFEGDQYLHQKDCNLKIYIEYIQKKKVIVQESENCMPFRSKFCPFESQGVLVFVESKNM